MTAPTLRRTPFDSRSTADDVLAGLDLTNRRAVVTGAATGTGLEVARALAAAGAEVTLAVRDPDAGEAARAGIAADTGNDRVRVGELDLSDPASVARFVRLWDGPLHMLVQHAGVAAASEIRTRAGWELQFATNHMGHFALATGLHWALTAVDGARVVSVSSPAHRRAPVDFDDLHFLTRAWDPAVAHAQSRTANVLFAVEAARRWADDGIAVNAVDPHALGPDRTPERAAATSVLLAASPWTSGVTGRWFTDCTEQEPAPHAADPNDAARLWDVSERLLRDETWHRAA